MTPLLRSKGHLGEEEFSFLSISEFTRFSDEPHIRLAGRAIFLNASMRRETAGKM